MNYQFPWTSFERQLHRLVRYVYFKRQFGKYGFGTFVSPFSELVNMRDMYLDDYVVISRGAWILAVDQYEGTRYQPRLSIGARTYIGKHATISCARALTIGTDVTIGDNVYLADCTHSYRDITRAANRQALEVGTLSIGNRVWIGKNAVVLYDLTVGDNAVIGAGSVVTRSVPPLTVVAGAPARPIKRYDEARKEWVRI